MGPWFTSDQHFGHANIIKHSGRPFFDLADMHAGLIARFNARVRDGELTYHLGDFSLDERMIRRILPKLRGRHILVAGNHDCCHPCHHRWQRYTRRAVDAGFLRVVTDGYVLASGERDDTGADVCGVGADGFRLCHFPYAGGGDRTEVERYAEWRPKDQGAWLLHGHVHGAWKNKVRMLNVGVDVRDYAPVSLQELLLERSELAAAKETA